MINKSPKTLQYDIMVRFMKKEDLENLMKSYHDNQYGVGGVNRGLRLNIPVTSEELELLRAYTQDVDKSIRAIALKYNTSIGGIFGQVSRTAVRVIAQHPEVLQNAK